MGGFATIIGIGVTSVLFSESLKRLDNKFGKRLADSITVGSVVCLVVKVSKQVLTGVRI